MTNVVFCQWFEHNCFIQTVQELRTEVCTQILHDQVSRLFGDAAVVLNAVQQILGSDIGGHDQDRIFKVYGTALGVGDTAVIEYLQQNVEDVRMRFLDLIEQNNRIWFSAHCLGQLAALLVAYISRRRSDQTGDGVFLHVFTHIDSNHVVLIIKQLFRQRFRKLCFTDTGRSKEQERTDRFCRILDSGFGTDDRIRNLGDCLILADNSRVKFIFQAEDLSSLAFGQFCNRDSGPAGDNSGNLFIRYTLVYQGEIFIFNFFLFCFQHLL